MGLKLLLRYYSEFLIDIIRLEFGKGLLFIQKLMIPTRKNGVLLNSIQEFIETEVWQHLTFFIFKFQCHILKSTDFLNKKAIHQIDRK